MTSDTLDPVALVPSLSKLLSEKLLIDVDSADQDLLGSGLLDSANLVELLLHLEEGFGFSVPFEELNIEDFRDLNRIALLIAGQRQAA